MLTLMYHTYLFYVNIGVSLCFSIKWSMTRTSRCTLRPARTVGIFPPHMSLRTDHAERSRYKPASGIEYSLFWTFDSAITLTDPFRQRHQPAERFAPSIEPQS